MFASTKKALLGCARSVLARRVAGLAVAVATVFVASAGMETAERGAALAQTKVTPQPKAAPPTFEAPAQSSFTRYSLRCWQYGRLVFEESISELLGESDAVTIKLQGADRSKSTYQIVDTRSSTCLIKPAFDRGPLHASGLPSR